MQTRRPRWPPLAGPAVASLTSPTSPIPSSRGRRSHGPAPPSEEGVAVSGLGCSAAPDAQDDGSRHAVRVAPWCSCAPLYHLCVRPWQSRSSTQLFGNEAPAGAISDSILIVIGNGPADTGLQVDRGKDFVMYTTKCRMKCSE